MAYKLFRKTNTKGKIMVWEGEVEGSIVKKRHYYLDSELPSYTTKNSIDKNVGRSNFVPSHTQALNDLEREKKKKIDQGYTESLDESKIIEYVKPMLFSESSLDIVKDLTNQLVVQPKLDGIRCIAFIKENNEVRLQTRNGKEIPFLNHIREEIKEYLPKNRVYDGELFNPKLGFQTLVRMANVSLKIPNNEESKVEYHIFDIVDYEMVQAERLLHLQFINLSIAKSIKVVESHIITDRNSIVNIYHDFLNEGFEGIIIRSLSSLYVSKRSTRNYKIKPKNMSEAIIVGYNEGEGIEKGLVIWNLKLKNIDSPIFSSRPIGIHEERRQQFIDGQKYVGKECIVKHQGLTNNSIPRFPIVTVIRDYE